MYICVPVGLLPKPDTCWRDAGVIGTAVVVIWAVDVVLVRVVDVMLVRVDMVVVIVGLLPLPEHPEPGVHWAYQGFWVEQQLPPTQFVGPVHPIPPHCPQRACCWARALPAKRAKERRAEGILET